MHDKFIYPPLLNGYYDNTFAYYTVVTTTWELAESMSGYAVELVRKARDGVSQEYIHLVGDMRVK